MIRPSLFALLTVLIFSCSAPDHDLLITNVNITDVETGEILGNRTVAIDGDSISAIYSKSIKTGKQTEVVDGAGKYLIPGLWDMHIHNNWNYEDCNDLMLANGITGGREMWGNMSTRRKMKEEIAAGKPIIDIYSAGVLTDGAPKLWPGSAEVTTPEEAEALVRCQVQEGADFIKTYSMLDSACFFAIGKTATELGVPFAGHVPNEIAIDKAIAAGMLTSEHLYGLTDMALSDDERKKFMQLNLESKWSEGYNFFTENFNDSLLDSSIEKMVKANHWFSPTMVTLRGYKHMYDSTFTSDPRFDDLPAYLTEGWKPIKTMEAEKMTPDPALIKDSYQIDLRILKALIRNDAKIIAGTDYPNPWAFPGSSMPDELEIYVNAGMTPLEALQTATINPAKVMQNQKIGRIKIGNLASLVLLNSNPLEDINAIRDIESVILRGKAFNRLALNDMVTNAKRKAAQPNADELIEDLKEIGNLPESLLALENHLDSVANKYHLSLLESSINSLGNKYLGEKEYTNALKVFELNTRLYPQSQKAWVRYAEGFLAQGDTLLALLNFQKALDIYPCNQDLEKRFITVRSNLKN